MKRIIRCGTIPLDSVRSFKYFLHLDSSKFHEAARYVIVDAVRERERSVPIEFEDQDSGSDVDRLQMTTGSLQLPLSL